MTETVTLELLVPNKVEGDIQSFVALASKFKTVEFCRLGVLLPFDLHGWVDIGVDADCVSDLIEFDRDGLERVRELVLGLLAFRLRLGVCWIHHLLIFLLIVAVQNIIFWLIKDLAFDLDLVGGVSAGVEVERVLIKSWALPGLILDSVGDPDPHCLLPLDIPIDSILDIESLPHHGVVQLLLDLPQILVLLYAISNDEILNSFGHVAVCRLSCSTLG